MYTAFQTKHGSYFRTDEAHLYVHISEEDSGIYGEPNIQDFETILNGLMDCGAFVWSCDFNQMDLKISGDISTNIVDAILHTCAGTFSDENLSPESLDKDQGSFKNSIDGMVESRKRLAKKHIKEAHGRQDLGLIDEIFAK